MPRRHDMTLSLPLSSSRLSPLRRFALASALAAGLSGCVSMAPHYRRPAPAVAQTWPTGPAYDSLNIAGTADGKPVDGLGWRQFFSDPQLRELIAVTLANNLDLRVAVLNIEVARAQYRIQRAALLPTINASGSATYERLPGALSATQVPESERYFTAAVGFSSYELDLFGRVRSLKDQALQTYFSTEAARTTSQISLIGEVATAYLTRAADGERLALAERTLVSQRASYDLTRRVYEAGEDTLLDLRQAETLVDTARSDVATYTTQLAQDDNNLTLLAGTAIPTDLAARTLPELLSSIAPLPADMSSAVLQRRPDILESEHTLRAANANIGAARAAFFPKISLTGSYGAASASLGDLFKHGSLDASFSPEITLPIFDAGANRASLRVAEADRDIDLAQYQQTIQTAFREVADALADRGTIDERMAAQTALVEASADSYRLSEALFRNGQDSFLQVLDSQRSLYTAQQNLITTHLAKLDNLVTLYKVLGGGAFENTATDGATARP
jgi:multidrug efflux system outer membrane protein